MDSSCGIGCFKPFWLQKFASVKCFMAVYGLLGTIQAMAYVYLVVTLTTMEKRFKIPSQTTGKIDSFIISYVFIRFNSRIFLKF